MTHSIPAPVRFWGAVGNRLWLSLTRRGILAVMVSVVLVSFYAVLYWSYDIDSLWTERQQKQILAPLEKKIAAAEKGGLAAAQGLGEQRRFILESFAASKKKSGQLPCAAFA